MIKNPIRINTQTTFADTLTGGIAPANWADYPLSDDDLILEAATLEDIELAYMGNEILAESEGAMFEAITTTRMKLAQTMRAFIRVLNRGLNGTDILAGTDEAGSDDAGQNTIGGAIIGKVRRVANIPVMTAQIPLTDGQTTSIIFHSPTADGSRVKNEDTLVAFQFLINKRDVTHVVAPIGGRDVSLNQVCQALSNLIERNSSKFQKAKERQARAKADIEGYLNEADKLANERSTLIEQVEAAQNGLSEKRTDLSALQEKLQKQKNINAGLQARLDKLKADKGKPQPERAFTDQLRVIKNSLGMDGRFTLSNEAIVKYITVDTAGGPESYVTIAGPEGNFSLQAKDMQGKSMGDAATKLLKAYRENKASKYQVDSLPGAQPAPMLDAGKYRYALQARPAGVGAVPKGSMAVLERPEQSDPYYEYARHGIITYDRKLSDEEASQYELRYLPTEDELKKLAGELSAEQMAEYAEGYIDLFTSDQKAFKSQVKIIFRKAFPNVAYPLGNGENLFVMDVLAALQASEKEIPPEPDPAPSPEPEPLQEPANNDEIGAEEVSEADQEANKALEYIKSVPSQFNSRDLAEINAELDHVQEAANALISAGRFDENEATVGAAVDHLINILAEIQQGGA